MSPKGLSFNFRNILQQTGFSRNPNGPLFYNFKNFALFEPQIYCRIETIPSCSLFPYWVSHVNWLHFWGISHDNDNSFHGTFVFQVPLQSLQAIFCIISIELEQMKNVRGKNKNVFVWLRWVIGFRTTIADLKTYHFLQRLMFQESSWHEKFFSVEKWCKFCLQYTN